MGPLFVTGATGFVGRELVASLGGDRYPRSRALVRDPDRSPALPAGWTAVRGDLATAAPDPKALAGVDTVIHLAAATGKASRSTMFAVNAAATRALVKAAETAGVRRFILVSSIAAGFADRRHYPYAESKLEAERTVSASRLDWLIVRPTAVFGPGSQTFRGLARLATAPVAICFGSGRVMLQPIHLSDLVRVLSAAIELPALGGQVAEAGGPDPIALEDLLRRIRMAAKGSEGPVIKVPVQPLRRVLALVEPFLLPVLPFTAGQLASFVNDGRPRLPPVPGLPGPEVGLARMLELEFAHA